MEDLAAAAVAFAGRNAGWLFWIALVFAMAETTAFLSFAIPSTAVLVGLGALAAGGGFALWPLSLGAALGAVLGATLSYALGRRWGGRMLRAWPLSRRPEAVARAAESFARRGAATLVLGHFLGPLRGVVFLMAGAARMPPARFLAWSAAGAVAWAFAVPLSGQLGGMAALWISDLRPGGS